MKLSDYKKSGFDHADFNTSYENEGDDTISSKFSALPKTLRRIQSPYL